MLVRLIVALVVVIVLAGCSSVPARRSHSLEPVRGEARQEVVLYALGLLDRGYRFGGSNPELGVDCSGMVAYVFRNAAGVELPHNARDIAALGRDVRGRVQPGDLVFFDTLGRPYSHVGIYIGDGRFVHASTSSQKVVISRLDNVYFAKRYHDARSLFAQ